MSADSAGAEERRRLIRETRERWNCVVGPLVLERMQMFAGHAEAAAAAEGRTRAE